MNGQYLEVRHRCQLPCVLGAGDIWMCHKCGSVYRSVAPGNPAYAGWRRLGPIGRWLLGVKATN